MGHSRRDILKNGQAVFAALLMPPSALQAIVGATASGMARIREQYVASVLPKCPKQVRKLQELGERYAGKLGPGGSWPDVNYETKTQSGWSAAEHLNRTRLLARAASLDCRSCRSDRPLEPKALRALG